jgi:uncharacterized protein
MIMDLFELVKQKAPEIIRLANKHGAENIRLFGSVARKEFNNHSDIDFLIDKGPKEKWSPWFPIGLANDLEEVLGRDVDLALSNVLKPRIKDKVLLEAIPLCEMIEKD